MWFRVRWRCDRLPHLGRGEASTASGGEGRGSGSDWEMKRGQKGLSCSQGNTSENIKKKRKVNGTSLKICQ